MGSVGRWRTRCRVALCSREGLRRRALGSWVGRVWLRRLRVLGERCLTWRLVGDTLTARKPDSRSCISYLLAHCVNYIEGRPDLER